MEKEKWNKRKAKKEWKEKSKEELIDLKHSERNAKKKEQKKEWKKIKSFESNGNIITANPVLKGMLFLVVAVYSQWKVLLSITTIFFILIFCLAGLTMVFDGIGNQENFSGAINGVNNKLTFSDAFWWVFVTISTVGYGDIYPITIWLRVWAIFIGIIGIAFLALYTAVVVNGFTQELQKRNSKKKRNKIFTKHDEDQNEKSEILQLKNQLEKLKKENDELKKIKNQSSS